MATTIKTVSELCTTIQHTTDLGTYILIKYVVNEADAMLLSEILKRIRYHESSLLPYLGPEFFAQLKIKAYSPDCPHSELDPQLLIESAGAYSVPINVSPGVYIFDRILFYITLDTIDLTRWAVFDHEMGHAVTMFVGFFNEPAHLDFVGQHIIAANMCVDYGSGQSYISRTEIIADYFMDLLGYPPYATRRGPFYSGGGNVPAYSSISGMRDVLLLYKPILDLVSGKTISSASWNTDTNDKKRLWFKFYNETDGRWELINNKGIYHYVSGWQLQSEFI
jgi:hypothetical protein